MAEVSAEDVASKYQSGKPFPVGALNGEPFDPKGSRTISRTPENFPRLEPYAHQFLHTLADISVRLEERLSIEIAKSWQDRDPRLVADLYHPYSPASFAGLVDALCSLVALPNSEVPQKQKPGVKPASIFKITDCYYDRIDDSLELDLHRPEGPEDDARKTQEATIVFYPRTSYLVYRPNGKPYERLCGHPRDELREMLTRRQRWTPDRIADLLERYKEIPPGIVANHGNAVLTIGFVGDQAVCNLEIKSPRYSGERLRLLGDGGSADKVGESSWCAEMKVPLEKFGGPKNTPTGGKITRWLESIITEIEKKAKIEKSHP